MGFCGTREKLTLVSGHSNLWPIRGSVHVFVLLADSNQAEYACYLHAMITDWRSKWSEGTQGNTRPELPFGFVQVHHS